MASMTAVKGLALLLACSSNLNRRLWLKTTQLAQTARSTALGCYSLKPTATDVCKAWSYQMGEMAFLYWANARCSSLPTSLIRSAAVISHETRRFPGAESSGEVRLSQVCRRCEADLSATSETAIQEPNQELKPTLRSKAVAATGV